MITTTEIAIKTRMKPSPCGEPAFALRGGYRGLACAGGSAGSIRDGKGAVGGGLGKGCRTWLACSKAVAKAEPLRKT